MAFDGQSVQPKKHAAIHPARIDPALETAQRGHGEQRSDSAAPVMLKRSAQVIADKARGAFGRLQRDIAGESIGDDHIGLAGRDGIRFDEAGELKGTIRALRHVAQ